MTIFDRYKDQPQEWVHRITGEVVEPVGRLLIGVNVVVADHVFDQRFDARVRGVEALPKQERDSLAKRGEIAEFTRDSQKRLMQRLGCWNVFGNLMMVTLTYPGKFPDGETAKIHFKAFLRDLRKYYPELVGMWKVEYQKRGAPHFHLVLQDGGLFEDRRVYMNCFRVWLNHFWMLARGASVPSRCEAKWARDNGAAKFYLAKEVGKTAQCSKAWQQEIGAKVDHYGRFWGWHGKADLKFSAYEIVLPIAALWIARRALQEIAAQVMVDKGRLVITEAGFMRPNGATYDEAGLPSWQLTAHPEYCAKIIIERVRAAGYAIPDLEAWAKSLCPFAEDQTPELWEEDLPPASFVVRAVHGQRT